MSIATTTMNVSGSAGLNSVQIMGNQAHRAESTDDAEQPPDDPQREAFADYRAQYPVSARLPVPFGCRFPVSVGSLSKRRRRKLPPPPVAARAQQTL